MHYMPVQEIERGRLAGQLIIVDMEVNGKPLVMELDTEAAVLAISN